MDRYADSRKYRLEDLLGQERARRLVELQERGKLARSTDEHVEYRDLIDARNRARRERWMQDRFTRASSSSSEAPMADDTPTPNVPPPPQEEERFAPPMEASPELEPEASTSSPSTSLPSSEVEDAPFPAAPDPPEVISGRKVKLRAHIAEFLGEWAGWIEQHQVWSPPHLLRKYLALIGASAAEGYGLLDHEPRKELALGVFLAGTFVAFVPVSFLALRRSMTWQPPAPASPAPPREPEEEQPWGDA